jgi:peptidoglycan/LPS O-acetylase OafA/YrhL
METVRLRPLDGVRALSALAVVAFHTWRYGTHIPAAGVGVPAIDSVASRLWLGLTVFFVLSGFLLFRPWAEYALGVRTAQPHLRRYLRARALRIIPGYWFALAAVIVLMERDFLRALALCAPIVAFGVVAPRSRRLAYGAASAAVVPLIWSAAAHGWSVDRFVPSLLFAQIYDRHWGVIGPAWTLDVEVTFYLAVPLLGLLVAAAGRRFGGRAAFGVAVFCLSPAFVIAPFYRSHVATTSGWHLAFPACIDQFAAGMVVALAVSTWPQLLEGRSDRRAGLLVALGALVVLVDLAVVGGPSRPLDSTWFDGIAATGFAVAILGVAGGGGLIQRSLGHGPLAWLGVISYGLYLWHEPIIHALNGHIPYVTGDTYLISIVGFTALATCGAAAQWFLAERPALRARRSETRP